MNTSIDINDSNNPPAKLRASADTLLDLNSNPGEMLKASRFLRESLLDLSEWDEHSADADIETKLDTGIAIAPSGAARCILDFQRTAAFLRGTLAAINAASANSAGEIDVLYAGCGPLAPLAIALCHRVSEVRFWPVDIHKNSVESVRRLVTRAGYEDKFGEIVCADATSYQWPIKGNLAIVEVMQRALEKEPQIAVTANLFPQLLSGGVLVPECISLEVYLADIDNEFDLEPTTPQQSWKRIRVPIASFLQLRAANAAEFLDGQEIVFDFSDPRELHAIISTRIDVHGDITLGDYDSGITMPWIAHNLGRSGPEKSGRIRLIPGSSPHLEASLR